MHAVLHRIFFPKTYFTRLFIHGAGNHLAPKPGSHIERRKPITLTAAAATVLIAVVGWAATTSSRVAALEASEVAHEQRISKAESETDRIART